MFMRMVYDERLAQAAYLIGCQGTGEAIVIDPERDVDRYIELADRHGLRIVAVAETHIHADFVSGSRELAHRINAKVYLSGEGGADWAYRWSDDPKIDVQVVQHGDRFTLGGIEFGVLHTPGHTPEHVCFVVTDKGSHADLPVGILTGDFMFVGDLGRPDLLETAAGQAGVMEASARDLYRTLRNVLDGQEHMADFVQVWPGHGAGSACGKALGAVPASTIGYERRFNPAIQAATDEASFVDFVLSGQPEPPLYFADMKRVNRDGPPVLGGLPDPVRIDHATLANTDSRASALIDARPWDEFCAAHVPGAMSFPLRDSFCTDVGSFVRSDEQITIISDAAQREEIIRCLIRIGLDRIIGWYDAADFGAYQSSGKPIATLREIEIEDARKRAQSGQARVLDVRRQTEFEAGHASGAINAAHTRLAEHLDRVDPANDWLVVCRSGARSARSSAFLQRMGYRVTNVIGGMLAWEKGV